MASSHLANHPIGNSYMEIFKEHESQSPQGAGGFTLARIAPSRRENISPRKERRHRGIGVCMYVIIHIHVDNVIGYHTCGKLGGE